MKKNYNNKTLKRMKIFKRMKKQMLMKILSNKSINKRWTVKTEYWQVWWQMNFQHKFLDLIDNLWICKQFIKQNERNLF